MLCDGLQPELLTAFNQNSLPQLWEPGWEIAASVFGEGTGEFAQEPHSPLAVGSLKLMKIWPMATPHRAALDAPRQELQ